MNEFIISKEVAESVLNYLAEQPFKEVAGLITSLQQIKPVAVKKPAKEGTAKK